MILFLTNEAAEQFEAVVRESSLKYNKLKSTGFANKPSKGPVPSASASPCACARMFACMALVELATTLQRTDHGESRESQGPVEGLAAVLRCNEFGAATEWTSVAGMCALRLGG